MLSIRHHAGLSLVSVATATGIALADDWYPNLEFPPGGNGLNSTVVSFADYGDGVAVVGDFSQAGPEAVRGVVVWTGGTWQNLGGGLDDGTASDVIVWDDKLIVTGNFDEVGGGLVANGVAAWNGTSWEALGSGLGLGGGRGIGTALAVYQGDLIVGGGFDTAGGGAASAIARWDGATWHALGGGVSGDFGDVLDLVVWNGDLIASGEYSNPGGSIGAWNGTTWSAVGSGAGFRNGIFEATMWALAVYQGDLIAGGVFDTVDGLPADQIARFDGVSWSAMGDGLGGGLGPLALTVHDDALLAVGSFSQSGATPIDRFARWDGVSSWVEEGELENAGWAIHSRGADLLLGGSFVSVDGVMSTYIAWRSPFPFWTDVANADVHAHLASTSGAWGDYDDDGDPDLYISGSDPKQLLRNDGGELVDVTAPPFDDATNSWGSLWVDLDDDGDLDLYLANHGANRYLRNDGGTFVDAAAAPLDDAGFAASTSAADIDLDGDLDLFVANQDAGTPNRLFRNDAGMFVDVAGAALSTFTQGYRGSWGDYDDDGDPDLYLTNREQANQLLRNDAGTLVDVTTSPLDDTGWGTGAAWGDLDNDGDLDLALTNSTTPSQVFRNDGGDVFTALGAGDLPSFFGGISPAWSDTDLDGDLDLFVVRSSTPNSLFRNDAGALVDVGHLPFDDTDLGRAVAPADVDGDGDTDLFLASADDGNRLVQNDHDLGHHWLRVDLIGTESNRLGVGARIELWAGGVHQTREVTAGTGSHAQAEITASFGLGTTTTIDSVRVSWPSGIVQTVTPAVDQRLTITEPPIAKWADATTDPLDDPFSARGVTWNDSDGDGDPDLYVVNHGNPNNLFRNDGGTFVRANSGPLGMTGLGSAAIFGDSDNDGDLDLFLTRRNGSNALLRNDGGNTFADVTSGDLGSEDFARGTAWADYDGDGDLDIYVVNDGQANQLLRNDGGAFIDVASGPEADAGSGRGVAWGDYDDDGDLDIYHSKSLGEANVRLRNGADGFDDTTNGDLGDTSEGRGVNWVDYDNDGDLDIYLTNDGAANRLYRNDSFGNFFDVTPPALAVVGRSQSAMWGDFDNDGDLDVYVPDFVGENRLVRNEGGGSFRSIFTVSDDAGISTGAAWSDYDGDGDLDIYVANIGENKLLRNDDDTGNGWLQVDLVGVVSNRFGIGARLELTAGGVTQTRVVSGGEGYLSQSSLTAHFGLGAAGTIDLLRVHWPSGAVTDTIPGMDQRIALTEPVPSLMAPELFEIQVPVGALATAAFPVGNATGAAPLNWTLVDDGSCAFLSVSAGAGTTEGGAESLVGINIDATALVADTHDCAVVITSNDPAQPEVTVEVEVVVRDNLIAPGVDVVLGTQRTPIGTQLIAIDLVGTPSVIGGTGRSFDFEALTVSPLGAVYATTNGDDHLYRLDGATGASIDLGSLGTGDPLVALAFDAAGDFWGVSSTPTLYEIDADAVTATSVATAGMAISGLAYDSVGDRLLGVTPLGISAFLLEIDRTTGATDLLAGIGEAVIDLAILADGSAFANDFVSYYSLDLASGATTRLGGFDATGDLVVALGIWSGGIAIGVDPPATVLEARVGVPRPNPFFGATRLDFTMSTTGPVRIDVFDASGRRVRSLLDEVRGPGLHEVVFDGSRLASGMYFYRVQLPGLATTRKMTLVR